VTAVDLDYDGAGSRATYRGGARLFQGDSVMVGETIVIDTEAGNLTATGSAGSTLPVREGNDGDGGTLVMTIASADELDYREDLRRLTSTGRAHVDGPQGDLLGRQIELYLRDDNTLDRVEAYDEVELRLRESGRLATGARLSFTAEDRKYVMSGTPVRIVGDCRESTGPVLTFYRSADKILIDGQQTSRTRVTSESECTEPSRTDRSGTGR
jgi:lipopolysaccharide export system protein LptA